MANEMFTQLPSVTSSTLADIICAVQANVSVQQTLQQVATLMLNNTILTYAGNPNTHLAGSVYQFCWDTTDSALYICTTTGTSSSAVWTLVCFSQAGLTNGEVFIGSTGNPPVPAALTPGTNISIVNGPGTITISSTGVAGIGWQNVTGTTQAMVPDTGYVADSGSLV